MQNKDNPLSTDASDASVKMAFTENRSGIRIRVNLKASYRLDSPLTESVQSWNPCTILNISAGGVLIAADHILDAHPEDQLFLKFHIGKEYLLLAQIVWEQHLAKINHYGLTWCNLPRASKEQLAWAITRVAVRRRRIQKK